MKLKSIKIRNYRSIDEIEFGIDQLDDGTFTYGLIGVNEAGKSTILKAMALKDGLKNEKGEMLPLQKDFKDRSKLIEIEYFYVLTKSDVKECNEHLSATLPDNSFGSLNFNEVKLAVSFDYSNPNQAQYKIEIDDVSVEDLAIETIKTKLTPLILQKSHKSIFWTAEDRYLIAQPINLSQFSVSPDTISIPLKNCFSLVGITSQEDIQSRLNLITESAECELLEKNLGDEVTRHIRRAWPNHPIKITFKMSDGLMNFHVHDLGTRGKAKTADQRSDGFKQFISFLLTISAQNRTDELMDSILLLDEPETHLHPQAQEALLQELIKITQNERNNIVFFATHSNYMIDKSDLSRNYRVFKDSEKKTEMEKTEKNRFDKKSSTYASVTYEVFDIPSTDYHNELYSRLHEEYQDSNPNDQERSRILNFDENFFQREKKLKADKPWRKTSNRATLPTYIRNCIHHPDSGNSYKEDELRKSVELLRSYL